MNSGWTVSGGTGVNQVASFALDYHEVTSTQIFMSGFPAS
jgi:hypothetical protein